MDGALVITVVVALHYPKTLFRLIGDWSVILQQSIRESSLNGYDVVQII